MSRIQIDRETLRSMYEDQKLSAARIGMQFGLSSSCILKRMKKLGIPKRRQGPQGGAMSPLWKGGMTIDKSGYVLRYAPDHPHANLCGYVREHRLVMEKALGRPLLPTEVVHHIDDDPANNAPSNLRLYQSNGEHLAGTLKGKCPQWTEAGKQRILDTIRKPRVALDADWQAVAEHYRQTNSLAACESKFGIKRELIARRLRQAGVPLNRRGAQPSIQWPSDQELCTMYQSMPMVAIARKIGVAESSVHRKLRQIGVPSRRPCDKAGPAAAMRL